MTEFQQNRHNNHESQRNEILALHQHLHSLGYKVEQFKEEGGRTLSFTISRSPFRANPFPHQSCPRETGCSQSTKEAN